MLNHLALNEFADMKKLLLSAASVFLSIHVGCYAYTHTIINQTAYKINVKLLYENDCQSNRKMTPLVIGPGSSNDFDASCPLWAISGTIVVDREDDTELRASAFWRAPRGRFLGNGTWTLTELNKCYVLNTFIMCRFAIKKIK
jgi:hypothetical protein